MNIHEYQAKELFARYGIPIPEWICVDSTTIARSDFLGRLQANEKYVVKAQIHAGGRGKGQFKENGLRGIQIAKSPQEVLNLAKEMLGKTLVTHQTGPQGKKVNRVYLTTAIDIAKEFYMALLLDRKLAQPVFLFAKEGGMDIEQLAAKSPKKIIKIYIDPLLGIQAYQARLAAFKLGLKAEAFKAFLGLMHQLYRIFKKHETSLIEINPLALTTDGRLEILDAKVQFDDNSLFRQPEIVKLRDLNEEDPKEIQASQFGLNYIALDGNIACLVNGAGLAMATMDIIHHCGGKPANFLDVGGGANAEQVREAFKIILSDPKVKGILINVFGGILRCDIIAHGILEAVKSVHLSVPLVVRLQGTNVNEARKLLKESKLPLVSMDNLLDAAKKIVELTR